MLFFLTTKPQDIFFYFFFQLFLLWLKTLFTGWNSSGLRLHCFRTAKIVIFDDITKPQDTFFAKKNFYLGQHFFALRLGFLVFFSYLCSAKSEGLLNMVSTAADVQKKEAETFCFSLFFQL